jgi:hypothetical protein
MLLLINLNVLLISNTLFLLFEHLYVGFESRDLLVSDPFSVALRRR